MRNSSLRSQILALIVFSTSLAAANTDIQGFWLNTQKQISVLIEATADGIRAKRTDQTTWYTYEQYREGQFRDGEGNNYYIIDQNTLEWEDSKGERRLRFTRPSQGQGTDGSLSSSEERQDPDGQSNVSGSTYAERHHYRAGKQISARSLDGRWQNRSSGQRIVVKGKRNVIKVKAHHSSWVSFTRQDHNTFVDRNGNHYDIIQGQLEYTSRSGDFYMRFRRGR